MTSAYLSLLAIIAITSVIPHYSMAACQFEPTNYTKLAVPASGASGFWYMNYHTADYDGDYTRNCTMAFIKPDANNNIVWQEVGVRNTINGYSEYSTTWNFIMKKGEPGVLNPYTYIDAKKLSRKEFLITAGPNYFVGYFCSETDSWASIWVVSQAPTLCSADQAAIAQAIINSGIDAKFQLGSPTMIPVNQNNCPRQTLGNRLAADILGKQQTNPFGGIVNIVTGILGNFLG